MYTIAVHRKDGGWEMFDYRYTASAAWDLMVHLRSTYKFVVKVIRP